MSRSHVPNRIHHPVSLENAPADLLT